MEDPGKHRVELTLTEYLAVDRNSMANERTLLAYLRTALTFVVAGVSLIQFFQYRIIVMAGYLLIPAALCILIIGYVRFLMMRKSIREALRNGVSGYKVQYKG